MLVFTSFVITGFPLSEDSLWTSSGTYCKKQDTRPVLFHSIPSFPPQCIHCLLDPSSSIVQGPASPLLPIGSKTSTHIFGSLLSLFSKGKLLKNQLVTPGWSCFLEKVLAQSGPDIRHVPLTGLPLSNSHQSLLPPAGSISHLSYPLPFFLTPLSAYKVPAI